MVLKLNICAANTTILSLSNSAQQPYTRYQYNYTPTQNSTYLTFQFRQDPAFWGLDNISVIRQSTNTEMIINGGFENDLTGWTLIGKQGLPAAGTVNTAANGVDTNHSYSRTKFFRDGAVGGVDGIYQSFTTVLGETYVVSFWLSNDGGGVNLALVQMGEANYDGSGNILNANQINNLVTYGNINGPTTPMSNADILAQEFAGNNNSGSQRATNSRLNNEIETTHDDMSGGSTGGGEAGTEEMEGFSQFINHLSSANKNNGKENLFSQMYSNNNPKPIVLHKHKTSIWVSGVYGTGHSKIANSNDIMHHHSTGGVIGCDRLINNHMIGATISYSLGHAESKQQKLNKSDIKTFGTGLYGRLKGWGKLKHFALDGFLNGSYSLSKIDRLARENNQLIARAKNKSYGFLGSLEASYKYHLAQNLAFIRPYMGFNYEYLYRPKYTERDAENYSLSYNRSSVSSKGIQFGTQIMHKLITNNYQWTFNYDFWYERKFGIKISNDLVFTALSPSEGIAMSSGLNRARDVISPSFSIAVNELNSPHKITVFSRAIIQTGQRNYSGGVKYAYRF